MKNISILILFLLSIGCTEKNEQSHLNATFKVFLLKAPIITEVIYFSNHSSPADVDAQGAFSLSNYGNKEIKELCAARGKTTSYSLSISRSYITHKFEPKLTKGCEFVISNNDDKVIIYIDNIKNIMLYKYIG